jgi:oligosaccharide repeat unit polymerase
MLKNRYSYYLILLFNSIISLLYIIYSISINGYYVLFSFLFFLLILIKNNDNILFFIRTFFLGIVGFIAIGAKIINENAYFGHHMHQSQTLEIATLMLLLTNIALFSSEIGFLLGGKKRIKKQNKIYFEGRKYFYFIFILLLFVASLIIQASGSLIISGGSYGHEEHGTPVLNNLNSISNILIYIMVLLFFKFKHFYLKKSKKYFYILLFSSFYLFIYAEFLRGTRMDALNGILGLVIISSVYLGKKPKITFKVFILGIFMFMLIQAMGMLRSIFGTLELNEIIPFLLKGFGYLFENPSTGIMFYQGTVNDIATTFSGIIMMLKQNMIDFYYGSSYFEYILRTPPKSLYPGRPEDLAWIFEKHGLSSGGGFFELAEAYLNFGVLGAFIVPFIISFLFAYAYKQFTINKYSIFHSLLLFSLLSGLMRGILYQTFTLYKSIVTGFLLYSVLYLVLYFLKNKKLKGE